MSSDTSKYTISTLNRLEQKWLDYIALNSTELN